VNSLAALGEGGVAALLDAAADGILVVDADGQILLANRCADQMFGYPAGALVGMSVDTLVPDRFRHSHHRHRHGYHGDPHARPMGAELDLFALRADGGEFPVEISLSALRTDAGLRVITIVRDITERRALEGEAEALRQRSLQAVSDAALRNLAPDRLLPAVVEPVAEALDADVVAITIREPETDTLRVRAVRGLPPELVGTGVAMGEGVAGRIAAGGPTVFHDAHELVDERWREHIPSELIGAPLVLTDEVIGTVVVGRERRFREEQAAMLARLSERIALAVGQGQLYEAAQAAESRLREIVGDVDGIVWEADDALRRRYSFVSDAAESMLGYPTAAWTDREEFWRHIIDSVDRDEIMTRAADPAAHELEYRVRRADGGVVWLRDRVRVSGPDGRARGLMVDVTERRELENNLLHAQKMQAVGQLAGGIAHDFNNMLTAIIGYSGLLAARLQDSENLEDLAEIERAAKRAQGLTEQLLSFSRRQGPRSELVDLTELVAGLEPMLRRLIDEDIALGLTLESTSVLVEADPGRLEQVLVNLVINARDAMPAGGTLAVSVEARDRRAALTVRDTGSGMDDHTRSRVFEPFFTTKPPGRGTGLGLATVYGIVDQAGGSIAIESTVGQGTEITVLLPMMVPEPEESKRLPTVLIVEDEAALRKLVRRVLERDGKRVLEASNGNEAMVVLEREAEAIDLMITDVVMPGMSGPELVEHVSTRWPDLRVVFSSGYTDSRLAGRGLEESGVDILRKPYTVEDLRRRVEVELAGGP
jgi:PAS domain S-box-containing protein